MGDLLKTVLFFPQARTQENFYLGNLSRTISSDYEAVGVNQLFHGQWKKFFAAPVCHLNWLENVRGANEFKCLANFFVRLAFLIFLKLFRKKIVWTVHNKVAHDQKRGRKYSQVLMKLLMAWSDKIHILCQATLDEIPELQKFSSKVICIPHGDYFENFGCGNLDIRKKYGIDLQKKIIFFTGKIGPYKNLELLIDCFNRSRLAESDYALLICGACKDADYRRKVQAKVNASPSVYADFRFVENSEMGDFLSQSDLLIAPYDISSSLNSGTMWMAFSYKRTMVLPEIGCVQGETPIEENAFVYRYGSATEHADKLCEALEKLKEETAESLSEKGNRLYSYMQTKSWNSHKAEWLSLYD